METNRLETLLESYLQGETSTAEEQLLREYFASPDVQIPDKFLYAKSLFDYFDIAATGGCSSTKYVKRDSLLLRVARIAIPLAAAAALAFMLIPTRESSESDKIAYCYINGQPIYDYEVAELQAEIAISTLSSVLQFQNQVIEDVFETLINKKNN